MCIQQIFFDFLPFYCQNQNNFILNIITKPHLMIKSTQIPPVQTSQATDPRFISKQVTRLIKNKIQPLSYKHYVLKSGNTSFNEIFSSREKQTLPLLTNNRKSQHKENVKPSQFKKSKNQRKQRRKALVQLSTTLDPEHYKQLQSKVEHHIMLKKILLMEDQYAQAEECNKEEKAKKCKKIWVSPLQKYIGMFEMTERPSEKVRLIDEASCEKILKQIKSVKSIKHIQCMEQNVRGMWNRDQKSIKPNKSKKLIAQLKDSSNHVLRVNQRKLKQQIITDIKKQYQTQGSTKIRININHQKMIHLD